MSVDISPRQVPNIALSSRIYPSRIKLFDEKDVSFYFTTLVDLDGMHGEYGKVCYIGDVKNQFHWNLEITHRQNKFQAVFFQEVFIFE